MQISNLRLELLEAHRSGSFLQTVLKASMREWDRRDEVASELGALHNEGVIDVVEAFGELHKGAEGQPDFFLTRHIFEKTLPSLSGPVLSVMRCVLHLYREAGQDLAAGTIIGEYANFCAGLPTRSLEALGYIEREPERFAILLPATVSAGCRTTPGFLQHAIRLCDSRHVDLKQQAIFSLASCSSPDEADLKSISATIEGIGLESNDDPVLAAVIAAAFFVLQEGRTSEACVIPIIENALRKGGPLATHALSESFAFKENFSPTLLDVAIPHLQKVPPGNGGTIRNIDFGIAQLLKTARVAPAISLLEQLLLSNAKQLTIENFPTSVEILRADSSLLSKATTRWFFNGHPALGKAVETIVGHSAKEITELYADAAELPDNEALAILFTARKAVGYLFFKPRCAASFVISCMHVARDAGVLRELSSLLYDPLLLNFTGTVRDLVAKRLNSEAGDVKTEVERAVRLVDEYLATLHSVAEISALQPSDKQRETFHQHLSQQVSQSFKKAVDKSLFLSLLSRSVILHGRSSIHYVYDPGGAARRMDMQLQRHGTELEVPRLEQLDPFGMEYMLRMFRAEQRKK